MDLEIWQDSVIPQRSRQENYKVYLGAGGESMRRIEGIVDSGRSWKKSNNSRIARWDVDMEEKTPIIVQPRIPPPSLSDETEEFGASWFQSSDNERTTDELPNNSDSKGKNNKNAN